MGVLCNLYCVVVVVVVVVCVCACLHVKKLFILVGFWLVHIYPPCSAVNISCRAASEARLMIASYLRFCYVYIYIYIRKEVLQWHKLDTATVAKS